MNKIKILKDKGITLIALIITIIVLVILAAVTINSVYKSRIIEYAVNGSIDYTTQGVNENKILGETEKVLDSVLSSLEGIGENDQESSGPPKPPEVKNEAPTKAVVSLNTKSTNSITVNAKSEDADGDNLTYILRYGTDQDNLDLSKELSDQVQNVQIAIQTPEDLEEYTYYYWRVDVTDKKVTTEGDIQAQVRTYCEGKHCSERL